MTDPTPTDREALATLIDEADNRWQHGIGAGGYDPNGLPLWLADVILASDWLREVKAEAWDEGRRTGASRAMRMMSDEPNLPLASETDNPYLGRDR